MAWLGGVAATAPGTQQVDVFSFNSSTSWYLRCYQDNPHTKNEPTNAPSRFGKMIFLDFWYAWLVKEGLGEDDVPKFFGCVWFVFWGRVFFQDFFYHDFPPANGEVSKFEKLKAARLG